MLETTRFIRLDTPPSSSATKVMLLGSGELGKEFELRAREASGKQGDVGAGMILGIHHATFLSGDLLRSRAFYENVLGLKPDPQRPLMSFEGVWYDVAPGQQLHLMVLPNPDAGVLRPEHGGRDRHLALFTADLRDLAQRLLRNGISFTTSQSGRKALFCRDPDDNALEFIEAAPR